MADGTFARPGAPDLRTHLFEPRGPVRGSILLTTGFSEHVGRYENVCHVWRDAGYLIGAWDWRGQGRSQGRRGYVERFDDYVSDLLAIADHFSAHPHWKHPVAFGHSMGALITIHAALRAQGRFAALALTSPFLALALPAPKWKQALARRITEWWPTWSESTGITGDMVTREPLHARAIDDDPLRIRKMTVRLFVESERAQEQALARAAELRLPIYCRAAEIDKVSSLDATRRFMASVSSSDKQLEIALGQYHELHQEPEWSEHATILMQQFDRWCSEHAAGAA